jgi:4-hydroxy-tetrahydrodipicolinate synthase
MAERPQAPFGRVLTAILTPFTDDGNVDYATFWKLIRHLGSNGSDGVVVAGTTGESPTLTRAEKLALFKAAVDAAQGSMTVVAGIGTYDTRESVELASAAAVSGVDGVMAVTPYYSKPPQRGIVEHMTAIADATDKSLLLYNIPGRTGTLIELETLEELAAHPNIVGVKDAVDDPAWSIKAIDALPNDFAVYSGSDSLTRKLMGGGAVGVVSVTSHLAGREVASLVEALVEGDTKTAKKWDDLLSPLNDALFLEPSPMPLKAGMTKYWAPVGDPRLPLVKASEGTLEAIGSALDPIYESRSE